MRAAAPCCTQHSWPSALTCLPPWPRAAPLPCPLQAEQLKGQLAASAAEREALQLQASQLETQLRSVQAQAQQLASLQQQEQAQRTPGELAELQAQLAAAHSEREQLRRFAESLEAQLLSAAAAPAPAAQPPADDASSQLAAAQQEARALRQQLEAAQAAAQQAEGAAYDLAVKLEEVEQQAVQALEQQQQEQVWAGHELLLAAATERPWTEGLLAACRLLLGACCRARGAGRLQCASGEREAWRQGSTASLLDCVTPAAAVSPQEKRLAAERELEAADKQIEHLTVELITSHVSTPRRRRGPQPLAEGPQRA